MSKCHLGILAKILPAGQMPESTYFGMDFPAYSDPGLEDEARLMVDNGLDGPRDEGGDGVTAGEEKEEEAAAEGKVDVCGGDNREGEPTDTDADGAADPRWRDGVSRREKADVLG